MQRDYFLLLRPVQVSLNVPLGAYHIGDGKGTRIVLVDPGLVFLGLFVLLLFLGSPTSRAAFVFLVVLKVAALHLEGVVD